MGLAQARTKSNDIVAHILHELHVLIGEGKLGIEGIRLGIKGCPFVYHVCAVKVPI